MKRTIVSAIGLLALGAAPVMAADIPCEGPGSGDGAARLTANWTGSYSGGRRRSVVGHRRRLRQHRPAGPSQHEWGPLQLRQSPWRAIPVRKLGDRRRGLLQYRLQPSITTSNANPDAVRRPRSATAGGRGWFGTVQAGCDYQFASRWVVGVFGDYDFSRIKGEFTSGWDALHRHRDTAQLVGRSVWPGRLHDLPAACSASYLAATPSAALRLGRIWAGTRHCESKFNRARGGPPGARRSRWGSEPYSGWFLGTGYEYQLDFLPGLFWKTEYRYAQYDRERVPVFFANGVPTGLAIGAEKEVQTIRSELVYRFNECWRWSGRRAHTDRGDARTNRKPRSIAPGLLRCAPHSVNAARLFSVERMPRS